MLFDVSIDSWKNISDGLNLITQTWRWLTDVAIQAPFTDGIGSSVSDQETKLLQKPFQPDEREVGTSRNCPGCHYLRSKNSVAFITGNKIS